VHHQGTTEFELFTHSNLFNSINNGRIDYDIDTIGGQSGCPVYLMKDSSQVVAIHKAYDPLKRLNFATMIT
jgi:glutamyl endopeptidase